MTEMKLSDDSIVALLQLFMKCTFEQLNMEDELRNLEFSFEDDKLWVMNPPRTISIPTSPDDLEEEDE